MTNSVLAQSYMRKADQRMRILAMLQEGGDYSDVIREAQEIVELCTKAMLRQAGIEPPKWHDVGGLLLEHREKYPEGIRAELARLAEISKWLRKERELAFYGDIDFIPSEQYTREDGERAIADAGFVHRSARRLISEEGK